MDNFEIDGNKIESRLYCGTDTDFYNKFFCDDIKGNDFIFLKEDFKRYMIDAKDDFLNFQENNKDKSRNFKFYQEFLNTIYSLNHTEKFKMKLVYVDKLRRIYIDVVDESDYYNLLRKVVIPNKSYLSISKLKNEEKILYYFKLIYRNSYENSPSFDNFDRNKIFFGAPGTGKSFKLNQYKNKLIYNDSDYERVTFHPDYSYAQFVGTYRPVSIIEDGKKVISYEYVPGPFMRILSKAIESSNSSYPRPFLLVIEEINRANMAAVFGDVFQLLDRDEENNSQYPINLSKDMKDFLEEEIHYDLDTIQIPSNMFIWATMNSADQGVFPMDTAFKRRWDFEYIDINNEETMIKDLFFEVNGKKINWNNLRKSINNFLLKKNINEDKLLGPFFVSNIQEVEKGSKNFIDIFKSKVLMYLYEDAAKSVKNTVFEPIKGNLSYSIISKEFDSKGIGIFHNEIREFYEKLDSYE